MNNTDCNKCTVENCRSLTITLATMYRDRSLNFNDLLPTTCKQFKPLPNLEAPVLFHLFDDRRKMDKTLKVLKNFELFIRQKHENPYFDIVTH